MDAKVFQQAVEAKKMTHDGSSVGTLNSDTVAVCDRNSIIEVKPARSRNWPWILALVFLNVLLFADAVFTQKTFFFRDVSFFHYPLKKIVTEAYHSGQWPLWNPYVQLGQPLLANPNTMALYPTQILFQWLPFELAFELHFVLHCIFAGVAAFYLARALDYSEFAAFMTAAIYNFSGVTLSFVNLFNILPVVVFLPLLTLSFVKILQTPTTVRLLAASLAMGIFGLLLEPLSSLAIAVFLVIFLTGYFLYSGRTQVTMTAAAGWFALVIASGMLLAAIQIVPTLELIRHSGRRSGLDFQIISGWSLHPVNLLQLVFPRVFGDYFRLTRNGSWAGIFFERREPYLLSCYFGAFSLLLASAGFFLSNRRWMSRTLGATALIGLLLASGKNGVIYPFLFEYCPLFRYGRYPVKYLLIFNFSLTFLAGHGIQRILAMRQAGEWRRIWKRPWLLTWIALAIAALSASFIIGSRFKASNSAWYRLRLQGVDLEIPFEVIGAALQSLEMQLGGLVLILALSWTRVVRDSLLKASIAIILLFDFGIHNYWINPLIQSELYEVAPAAAYLEKKAEEIGPFRVYRLTEEGPQNEALTLGSTNSIAWSFFHRKLTLDQFLAAKDHVSYAVFQPVDRLETLPSQRIHSELLATQSLEEKLQFLAGLNVEFVLAARDIDSSLVSLDSVFPVNSPQPLRLYRLRNALPRAFLTQSQGPADGGQSFRDQLSVRGEIPAASDGRPERVQIINYRPNQIEIDAEASQNRLLVLLDSYYPGWSAFVDGLQTPVVAANFVYRAIRVPQGRHHVTFRYEPRSFIYGAAISGTSALIWCAVLLANLIRRSTARQSPAHA